MIVRPDEVGFVKAKHEKEGFSSWREIFATLIERRQHIRDRYRERKAVQRGVPYGWGTIEA